MWKIRFYFLLNILEFPNRINVKWHCFKNSEFDIWACDLCHLTDEIWICFCAIVCNFDIWYCKYEFKTRWRCIINIITLISIGKWFECFRTITIKIVGFNSKCLILSVQNYLIMITWKIICLFLRQKWFFQSKAFYQKVKGII